MRKDRQYATAGDTMDIEALIRSLDASGANSSAARPRVSIFANDNLVVAGRRVANG